MITPFMAMAGNVPLKRELLTLLQYLSTKAINLQR
jgi:hypothetical protein